VGELSSLIGLRVAGWVRSRLQARQADKDGGQAWTAGAGPQLKAKPEIPRLLANLRST